VALQKPDVVKRLQDMGAEPKTSTPAAFASFWRAEIDRYRDLVKLSGAKIE
jgi:tripartite-type tricarboxylate transporter receptor subunit TctC